MSGEGVRPLSTKVCALKYWATPMNLDKLRSFLGLACYYRHFDHNYSAAPFNFPTCNFWAREQHKVCDKLKKALATYNCLRTIHRYRQLVVDMDTCDVHIGLVLH